MIRVYDVYERCDRFIRPDTILEVGDKSTHHGARSLIRLDDGRSIYISDEAEVILKKIAEAVA